MLCIAMRPNAAAGDRYSIGIWITTTIVCQWTRWKETENSFFRVTKNVSGATVAILAASHSEIGCSATLFFNKKIQKKNNNARKYPRLRSSQTLQKIYTRTKRYCSFIQYGPNHYHTVNQLSYHGLYLIICHITSYFIWSHDYVCRPIWSFCSCLSCFYVLLTVCVVVFFSVTLYWSIQLYKLPVCLINLLTYLLIQWAADAMRHLWKVIEQQKQNQYTQGELTSQSL